MNERSKKRFRCMGFRYPKRSWSIGVEITHNWGETFIELRLGFGAIMIGLLEDW